MHLGGYYNPQYSITCICKVSIRVAWQEIVAKEVTMLVQLLHNVSALLCALNAFASSREFASAREYSAA